MESNNKNEEQEMKAGQKWKIKLLHQTEQLETKLETEIQMVEKQVKH